MSNEEFERHVEFTLQQQAKFDTSLAKHQQQSTADWAKQRERNAEFDSKIEQLVASLSILRDAIKIEQLVASLSILRDAIIGLTHHVERHDNYVERHEQEMAEIRRANAQRVELGKEMDARLNALMLVVERHISDHQ